jgi:spore germination cell wall hydrolase CwlJ-like protein
MAEFVNRADYISKVTEHDRKLLEEYTENKETIVAKELELKENQNYLQSLQDDLKTKEKELNKRFSDTSSALTQKLEQAKKEAERLEKEAQEKIKPVPPKKEEPKKEPETVAPPETTTGSAVEATDSDVELLAALLECEAGSSNYEALLAVGSVVVNRMKNRYYPDTVEGVIYHSGQFPPAHNGKLDKILERGVKPLCVTAARDALSGKNNIGDCLEFRAASSNRPGIVIGDNVFF